MELTQTQVEALPCSVPANKDFVKVHDPADRSGSGSHHGLNTYPLPETSMSKEAGIREVLANLLDQLASSNGSGKKPTYYGMKMLHGKRETTDIIFFHNGKFRLGEIHVCKAENRIMFINYGPTIESGVQVFAFGDSKKVGIPNQIGQHAEGLKRALAAFVYEKAYSVIIECAIKHEGQTEFRKWNILVDKDNLLFYKETKHKPNQLFAGGPNDTHRIQVTLTGESSINFNIFNYIIPDQRLLRDQNGENDPGMIFFEADLRGTVYVWHFKVAVYEKQDLRFSYDIFLPKITRDRDMIEHAKLIEAIAAVWSVYITKDVSFATMFYNEVLMKFPQTDEDYYEFYAIKKLSQAAKNSLISLFKKKNPSSFPLVSDDKIRLSRVFMCSLVMIPQHAKTVFDSEPSTCVSEVLLRQNFLLFKSEDVSKHNKSFMENVAPVFAGVVNVSIASHLCNSLMSFFYDTKKDCIILNESLIKDMSDVCIIGEIWSILANTSGKNYDRGMIVSNLKKVIVKSIPVVPTVVPPAAPAASEPSSSANKREREEEEFLIPTGFKRLDDQYYIFSVDKKQK